MPTVPDFSWLPSSRARYEHMLGAVPPAIHLTRGFLVGEAQHHDDAGVPYFTAFRCPPGGEYQTGSRPLSVAEFRVAVSL
jgi:hypothetical protein